MTCWHCPKKVLYNSLYGVCYNDLNHDIYIFLYCMSLRHKYLEILHWRLYTTCYIVHIATDWTMLNNVFCNICPRYKHNNPGQQWARFPCPGQASHDEVISGRQCYHYSALQNWWPKRALSWTTIKTKSLIKKQIDTCHSCLAVACRWNSYPVYVCFPCSVPPRCPLKKPLRTAVEPNVFFSLPGVLRWK